MSQCPRGAIGSGTRRPNETKDSITRYRDSSTTLNKCKAASSSRDTHLAWISLGEKFGSSFSLAEMSLQGRRNLHVYFVGAYGRVPTSANTKKAKTAETARPSLSRFTQSPAALLNSGRNQGPLFQPSASTLALPALTIA